MMKSEHQSEADQVHRGSVDLEAGDGNSLPLENLGNEESNFFRRGVTIALVVVLLLCGAFWHFKIRKRDIPEPDAESSMPMNSSNIIPAAAEGTTSAVKKMSTTKKVLAGLGVGVADLQIPQKTLTGVDVSFTFKPVVATRSKARLVQTMGSDYCYLMDTESWSLDDWRLAGQQVPGVASALELGFRMNEDLSIAVVALLKNIIKARVKNTHTRDAHLFLNKVMDDLGLWNPSKNRWELSQWLADNILEQLPTNELCKHLPATKLGMLLQTVNGMITFLGNTSGQDVFYTSNRFKTKSREIIPIICGFLCSNKPQTVCDALTMIQKQAIRNSIFIEEKDYVHLDEIRRESLIAQVETIKRFKDSLV